MVITNEQQFYSFVRINGINARDYDTKEELYGAIFSEDKMEPAMMYIIKNNIEIDSITPRVLEECAIFLSPEVFKKVIIGLKEYLIKDNYNFEDLVISRFRKNTNGVTKSILKLFFETLRVSPDGKHGMIFTEACHYGCERAVKYLIEERKVDPNINDEYGFIFACRFLHYKLAKYLALHGANIKAKNCLSLKVLQMDSANKNSKERKWLIDQFK